MDKKHWIIFTVVVIALFGGIIWFSKNKSPAFTGDATRVIVDGPIQDHVAGSAQQKVVLIEYGDFQCPGCGGIWAVVKELKTKYSDKLTFVFRNLPLTNIHPNALAAATAAESAGLQGKYFEMHDLLFQSQGVWQSLSVSDRTAKFEELASTLGLNMEKFKQDLASQDIVDKINRDRATAKTFDANQTPTFVLNGQKLSEEDSKQIGLVKAVEEALSKVPEKDFTGSAR